MVLSVLEVEEHLRTELVLGPTLLLSASVLEVSKTTTNAQTHGIISMCSPIIPDAATALSFWIPKVYGGSLSMDYWTALSNRLGGGGGGGL